MLNVCMNTLYALVTQPWWNRIWVVQEVILPPVATVIFGQYAAPLRMFADAAKYQAMHSTSCCRNVLTLDDIQTLAVNDFTLKLSTIDQSWKIWNNDASIMLPDLLRLYYTRDASDPRDKIYGLLGLVRDWGNSRPIRPNYNIDIRQLYEDIAFCWVELTQTLDFLSFRAQKLMQRSQYEDDLDTIQRGIIYHTDIDRHSSAKFKRDKEDVMQQGKPEQVEFTNASWATDWEHMTELGFEKHVADRIERARLFKASGDRPALRNPMDRRYTRSPALTRATVLTVTTYRIGRVQGRGQGKIDWPHLLIHDQYPLNVEREFPLPLRQTKDLAKPYLPRNSSYTGSHAMTKYDAICRALCGDTFLSSGTSPYQAYDEPKFRRATDEDVTSIHQWRAWMHKTKHKHHTTHQAPEASDFTNEAIFHRVLDADRAIRSMGVLRRFIELDSGHIGIAENVREDDEVMVLMGAKTPFALRKLGKVSIGGAGRKTVWSVIAECYVIGAMDGEIVEAMEREGRAAEEIYLI